MDDSLSNSFVVMGMNSRKPVIYKFSDNLDPEIENMLLMTVDTFRKLALLIYSDVIREETSITINYRSINYDQLSYFIGKCDTLYDKLCNINYDNYVCFVVHDSGNVYLKLYDRNQNI
jgi:hypothetical protein